MIEMTDNEKIERLKLFLEEQTYTYIKDTFNFNFNGFIFIINETKIKFNDDILGIIPIRIEDIKEINYSTKKRGNGNEVQSI